MTQSPDLLRRTLIKGTLVSALCLSASPALAMPRWRSESKREIAFYNLHTDEKLRLTYWKEDGYDRAALAKINYLLRDFRTGDVHPISPNLLDLLHDLQAHLRTDKPIDLISGYRSPQTNARLAEASDGVARKSYHMKGLAADIRLPDVSLRRLQTEALFMSRGGVGFYPRSNFVHVDVGPVRRWG